jgi:hypothetical protein
MRIRCDGGLGNRLNALFTGLIGAEAHGWTPLVIWPANKNCGAGIGDMFASVPFEYHETCEYVNWPLVTHWPWENRSNHNIKDLERLAGQDIELTDHSLRFSERLASDKLRQFVVQPDIVAHVDEFCTRNGINRSVRGYQVRGSDNYHFKQHTDALNAILDKTQRFFVCSDDKSIEDSFVEFENVILHPKTHYTEKLQPGNWISRIPKSTRVEMNGADVTIECEDSAKFSNNKLTLDIYNVYRGKEHVIEAVQDMLILAKTTLVRNPSTFNQWAYMFSTVL